MYVCVHIPHVWRSEDNDLSFQVGSQDGIWVMSSLCTKCSLAEPSHSRLNIDTLTSQCPEDLLIKSCQPNTGLRKTALMSATFFFQTLILKIAWWQLTLELGRSLECNFRDVWPCCKSPKQAEPLKREAEIQCENTGQRAKPVVP